MCLFVPLPRVMLTVAHNTSLATDIPHCVCTLGSEFTFYDDDKSALLLFWYNTDIVLSFAFQCKILYLLTCQCSILQFEII